jgi:hypothetical protein
MTKTLVERLEEQGRVGICGVPDDFEWVSYAQAAAEITRLASRIEELERALKPFAEAGATLSSRWEDHETHWQGALSYPISAGQLRAARQALSDKG